MTTDNLILLHLRDIRASQDRMEEDVKEVKHRLLGVERSISSLRRDDVDILESA